jgi:hypothetical protein
MTVQLRYLFVMNSNLSTGFRWGGKRLAERQTLSSSRGLLVSRPRRSCALRQTIEQYGTLYMNCTFKIVYTIRSNILVSYPYTLKMEAPGSSEIFVPIY